MSRRKILWGLATTGAAASAGGGTAALLADSERAGAALTAGSLDLDTEPSWGNDTTLTATKDVRSETVEISVSDNPGYLWLRTACKQCTQVEEHLYVTIRLDTHGDGTDGIVTQGLLGEVREELGSGVLLDGTSYPGGEFPAGGTWTITVEWHLQEQMYAERDVSFDFEYHVTQSRHVDDQTEFAPSWTCDGCSDGGNGPTHDISWVSFCADGKLDLDSGEDGNLVVDGSTLEYDLTGLSEEIRVDAIVVKYGGQGGGALYVISPPADTGSLPEDGAGTWHDSLKGNGFARTDRTNSGPCPGKCWTKYEVDEMKFTENCDNEGSTDD